MVDEKKIIDLLDEFDIDPNFGFLLRDPLIKLPDPYQPWHDIADRMPELIKEKKVNEEVKSLPEIKTDILVTNRELRLAHLLLSTITAGYIWEEGIDKARLSIPRQIGTPLLDVSRRLGFKPIVCHASACLANWKPIRKMDLFEAEAVDLIAFKYLSDAGNRWFFCLTAQMETELAPAICAIVKACVNGKASECTMRQIKNSIEKATRTIQRMEEHLSPEVFYHQLRPFLSGYTSELFKSQGGVIFEGHEEIGAQKLNGGSAAQSSPFHVIDAFLGIIHSGEQRSFLKYQQEYMPPKHQKFIKWIEQRSSAITKSIELTPGYDDTLGAIRKFREIHLNTITKYIVQPAKMETTIGTGGSSFLKLLVNIISDCHA